MPVIQIATPFNIDIEFEVAEFHKRLLAYLIDFALIIIYYFGIRAIFSNVVGFAEETYGFWTIVKVFPMLFYTPLTELLLGGQTVGKKILNIKVVALDGAEPTLGQVMLRWFLRFYEWGFVIFSMFWYNPFYGMGFLFMGGITSVIIMVVSQKSQRLGDIVAGTVVVNTKSTLTVHDTIFKQVSQTDYKVTFPEVMKLSDRDINTIKNVIIQAQRTNNFEMCNRVAFKVQDVLKIPSSLYAIDFLEKILEDYNYLSTRE
jgi:uncharacterized RDD family membrane protein YckC